MGDAETVTTVGLMLGVPGGGLLILWLVLSLIGRKRNR